MTSIDYSKIRPSDAWYLAHPVADDDKYTREQNLEHVLKMLKLCWEEGFPTVAPYHTTCLIFTEHPEFVEPCLAMDVDVVCKLGKMIMAGHKVSNGMALEIPYAHTRINLVGLTSHEARLRLREFRAWQGNVRTG
jgi:hypothetical protein